MKIACPKCDFRPSQYVFWNCSCGHEWHPFATRGVCPECSKCWQDTQCPRCGIWSPHVDWYEKDVPEQQVPLQKLQSEPQEEADTLLSRLINVFKREL
jgi:hypothetical protein